MATNGPAESNTVAARETASSGVSWWRVLVFAMGTALAVFFLARQAGSYGWSLVAVLPLVIGLAMGALGRQGSGAVKWSTGVIALGMVVVLTVMTGIAGVFCTLMVVSVSAVPLMIGVLVGWWLRHRYGRARSKRTTFCLALAVLPVSGLVLEATDGPTGGVEEVRTVRVVDLAPEEAWANLVFYEDVRLPRPWLARIGLPHPLYTEGKPDRVGAVTRCVYDGGWLRKRITARDPGRLVAFEVIEQHGIEDRSIELVDGSFELVPTADGRTRVTLVTRYLPLLEARAFWRSWEHRTTRALHEHVIAGMVAGAAAERAAGAAAGAGAEERTVGETAAGETRARETGPGSAAEEAVAREAVARETVVGER